MRRVGDHRGSGDGHQCGGGFRHRSLARERVRPLGCLSARTSRALRGQEGAASPRRGLTFPGFSQGQSAWCQGGGCSL